MARELGRYVGSEIAQQIGVVRLDDDLTAGSRGIIQATQATAKLAEQILVYGERQYIDDFQIQQREKFAEISAKHPLDPEAFRKEWQAHSEGTLGAVPSAFSRSARTVLGDWGSKGYADIIGKAAANERRNSEASWKTERANKEDEVLAAAARVMQGTAAPDEAARAHAGYAEHLEAGRKLGFVDEKMAKLYREQVTARADLEARGEAVRQRLRGIYAEPAPDAPARTSSAPRPAAGDHFGYANNNPGNIMVPKGQLEAFRRAYPGAVGVDARGFAKFETPEAGLAAMATVIRSYGENTLLGILSRYAPKGHGDNDPEAYAATVGQSLGVSPVEKVNVNDPAFMARLIPAMIKVETGQAPKYAPEMYREASTPGARGRLAARQEIERFREEVRADPKLRTLYPDVTFAQVEQGIRRQAAELEAERAQARADNNEDFSLYTQRLSRGLDVDVGEAQRRAEEARRLGDTRAAKRWEMVATKGAALTEFGRLPLPQQAAELEASYARAQKNTRDDSALFEYEIKHQAHVRAREEYKRDSFTYAHRVQRDLPAIPDVNWAKPDVAALRQIAAMVPTLETRSGMEIDPLPAGMMNRFASTWNAANGETKQSIAATLNDGLGPKLAARVFGKLSKDGHVDNATVYAASLAEKGQGPIAREIFQGLDIMKETKKAPKLPGFEANFNEHVGGAFGRLNPEMASKARDGAWRAVEARIAKWAFDNGKLGEDVPSDVQQEIIKTTIGPVLRHNGGQVFPPRRDMNQRDLDAMLSRIRDQDAPKLKALDGSEVLITRALRSGALENVGDGSYVLRFGDGYLTDPKNPRRPYVIDKTFFAGVESRIAAEDFGAFTGGEPPPDRTYRGSRGQPLGVPVNPKAPFAEPKGGVTGQ